MRFRRILVAAASALALAAGGATYASHASAQGGTLPAQIRAATARIWSAATGTLSTSTRWSGTFTTARFGSPNALLNAPTCTLA